MSNDEYDDKDSKEKPKRYPLHWDQGLEPDDIDREVHQPEDE